MTDGPQQNDKMRSPANWN